MLVQLPIDAGDFRHPAAAIGVLHVQDLIRRPMKVKGDEGYLLVQRIEGVAHYPPRLATSARNSCWHWGHTVDAVSASSRFHSL